MLLVGYDLASFIGRKAVKDFLEPVTLKQIEIGKNIAEQLAGAGKSLDGIEFAVKLLLSRDSGWKEGHREAMAAIAKEGRPSGQTTENEKVADFECRAWLAAKSRKIQDAQELLRKGIEITGDSPFTQAELFYRMAGYLHFLDAGQALRVHHSAYKLNSELPRPVELPSKRYLKATEQVVNIRNYFSAFATASAAIAELEGLKAKLSYGHSADAVESALQELGVLLGANSSRPEKETNRGPDVLWQFPELTFCIEAKSEKTVPIYKDDAKQLLLSTEWCKNEVDVEEDKLVSVFATNSSDVDRPEDVAFGPLILNESVAVQLVDDLKKMVTAMTFDGPLFSNTSRITELIGQGRLTPRGIQARLIRFN